MMNQNALPDVSEQSSPGNSKDNNPAIGCSFALLMAVLWIGGVVTLSQAAIWVIEQGVVEGSIRADPGRHLISLLAGLAIVIPFGLLTRLRHPVYRLLFKTWALAGVMMIFLAPARMLSLTDSQGVAGLQLAGLGVFIFALWAYLRRLNSRSQVAAYPSQNSGMVSALAVALVLGAVWSAIGALGSWLDTVLGLAVGLAGGVAAFLVLQVGILRNPEFAQPGQFGMKGVIISQVLVMLSAGLGINGNQWVLLVVVPVLGWLAGFWLRGERVIRSGFVWLVGLALSWPLIWVDADELSLIITSGTGELLEWVASASIIDFSVGLILSVVMFVGMRWIKRRPGKFIQGAGMAAAVILLVAVYILHGTPGFYGEKLFVILKDQANLDSIPDTMAYAERREAVYRQLTAHAERTQADLRRDLRNLGVTFTPFYLVNALEVDGGPLVRLWLSQNPAVDRVLDNPILRPLPEPVPQSTHPDQPPGAILWNLRMIQADRVWRELNVKGKGIIIGQSDSGVQGTHPELAEQYRGAKGFSDRSWFDPWYNSPEPVDIGGHGTHTLGTALGKTVGVAPEAEWIGCVNLARNLGNPSVYLKCMQFMLAPFPRGGEPSKDGDPAQGAHVLNNSWGCPWLEGCDARSLASAVSALRKAGVFVVVSAGNSGLSGCGSVDSPLAIYSDVYTVGAIDRNGFRAEFSSLGPVEVDGSYRVKPDIMAPGQGVYSAYPGNGYNTLGGTSMAGPHVVGVVALMWSANPDLIGDIDLTTRILNQTAKPYTGLTVNCDGGSPQVPSNVSGYGIVDAFGAVQAAIDLKSQTELR